MAYAHLTLADRAELHTAVAGELRRRAARGPGALEQAAVQAERALECVRELRPGSRQEAEAAALAAGCLAAAARRAVSRSDVRTAVELATRARELAEQVADVGLGLEAASIESYALAACGHTAQALALIDRTAGLGPASANPAAAFQLRANELALRPAGPEAVRAARRLAERSGDGPARARLLLLEALDAIGSGDYRQGERLLADAYGGVAANGAVAGYDGVAGSGRAVAADVGLGTAEIYANLSLCLAFGDSPVRVALARCAELRESAAGAPVLHALVGCSAALLHAFAGEPGPARDQLDQAREVFAGVGHRAALAGLYQFRSAVEEWAGDPVGAAHWQRAAAACFTEAGAGPAADRCLASAWLLDRRDPAPAEGRRRPERAGRRGCCTTRSRPSGRRPGAIPGPVRSSAGRWRCSTPSVVRARCCCR